MRKNISKIMLLDDEEMNLKILKRYFQRPYHQLELVSDPRIAIHRIRNEKWSAIITDLRMPGINGIDVLREISLLGMNAIRVVITAFASTQTMKEIINEDLANYILEKPFSKEEIHSLIQRFFTPIQNKYSRELELNSRDLWSGLVNEEDVFTDDGLLLVSKGTSLDPITIKKLRKFEEIKGESYTLRVREFKLVEGEGA